MMQAIQTALAQSHNPFGLLCAMLLVGTVAAGLVGFALAAPVIVWLESRPAIRRRRTIRRRSAIVRQSRFYN